MFTPITIGSKKLDKQLGIQQVVEPITSVAQTETGIWDITKAGFEISYNEERYGSLQRQLDNNGWGDSQTEQLVGVFRDNKDEFEWETTNLSENSQRLFTAGALFSGSSLFGVNRADNYSLKNVLEQVVKSPEKSEWYENYRKENPELNLPDLATAMNAIKEQHKVRAANLQDALSRNDSDFQKFVGNLAGGFGAALDPMLIPGIALSIATGGGKWYAEAGLALGITALEEGLIIQPDVAQFKEFLGEDYDQWLAVVMTSGFAAAIPIFGKLVSKAINLGKIQLTPAVSKLLKNADDVSTKIDDVKVGDAYEANRAARIIEETGGSKGAKLPIHKNSDINLKDIDVKFDAGLKLGNAKAAVSTLLAKVGSRTTNIVLEQMDKLGRQFDELDGQIIQMISAQKSLDDTIDVDKAFTDINLAREAQIKADNVRPIKKDEAPVNKLDDDAEYIDYDVAEEEWLFESASSRANPASPKKTNKDVYDEIIEQEEKWKNFDACVKGA